MSLTTAFAGPTAAIQGRVETNEFPCVTFPGEDVSYSGVFPLLSRVNHACDANAMIEWDADEFVVVLKTTRMVKIGDEICFCYIVPFQKRQQRREELMLKVSTHRRRAGWRERGLTVACGRDLRSGGSSASAAGAACRTPRAPRRTRSGNTWQSSS